MIKNKLFFTHSILVTIATHYYTQREENHNIVDQYVLQQKTVYYKPVQLCDLYQHL
jgi:hypothetical protein